MKRGAPAREPVPAVELSRTIAAPPAEVFRAWTEAPLLARWLAAHDCDVREARADARAGGAYHLAVVSASTGHVHVTTGEYVALEPPTAARPGRVTMTWRYEGPHGADAEPSLVTVLLHEGERPGTTRLVLRHERARDLTVRALLAEGWPTVLDKLEAVLGEATA